MGEVCDFCGNPATIDGRTKLGAWAFMCDACHSHMGVGLGLGKGQKLRGEGHDRDTSNG